MHIPKHVPRDCRASREMDVARFAMDKRTAETSGSRSIRLRVCGLVHTVVYPVSVQSEHISVAVGAVVERCDEVLERIADVLGQLLQESLHLWFC